MNTNLKEKIKSLPKSPGVYIYKDKSGKVIYVGKAINLFNRVNSYFHGAHNYKTTKLVASIEDMDFISVNSEKEALILEYNLIKEYNPRFNIAFKDDKSYPYILLQDESAPYLKAIRRKKKNNQKGKLYGPYPNVEAANNTVAILNELYPTRKCENLKKKSCLYYHMSQCPGYCLHKADNEARKTYKRITEFLSGNDKDVIKLLKEKMLTSAEIQNYEEAARYKNMLSSIEATNESQSVQKNNKESFDVFNYYEEDGLISIIGLFVKSGKITAIDKYIDYKISDDENLVSSYIYRFYQHNEQPKLLVIPKELKVFLKDTFEIKVAQKGFKKKLLDIAKQNGKEMIEQKKKAMQKDESTKITQQQELNQLFGKEVFRIEAFDNSHTSGQNTVGAMVVFKDLKPSKKDYRMYKLENSADDLASMREMLTRRYSRMINENSERPDLIIMDGGEEQVKTANEILTELGIDITLIGLGKDNKHNTSYVIDSNCQRVDIDPKSNLFFLFTNIQDEVHRFAITYHKKLRTKDLYD